MPNKGAGRPHPLCHPLTVGADSFIAKPVSGATLVEAVRDYAVEVAVEQNPQGEPPLGAAPRDLGGGV